MSLQSIENVKKSKPFQWRDIFLYLFLALMIALMFLAVWTKNKEAGEITGLEIRYDNNLIASYLFDEGELRQEKGYEEMTEIQAEDSDSCTILIQTGGDGYNTLVIDTASRRADMADANCSSDKDCTYMHIRYATDSIICIPHKLVITATTDSLSIPDIIV